MIPLCAKTFEISSVEDQRAEVCVDRLEESLCRSREGQVCYWHIGISFISINTILQTRRLGSLSSGVVISGSNTHAISQMPPPSTPKCLNRKDLSLLHLSSTGVLHEYNLLVAMDLVLLDIVPSQAADSFDGVGLALEFDLVALHDFLDRGAYVADACIDSGFLQNVS